MGLSSSQARLLSLTSRQHAVEGEAQRIMANKLRLSNDSDAAYNDYIQALDETQLKVLRNYNKTTAKSGWVDASINNLLRYGYTDEFNKGTLYFVQDIETGGLYVPKSLIDKFDPNMEMREFVAQFEGITYEEIDTNESARISYQEAMDNNYAEALGSSEAESLQNYIKYNDCLSDDKVLNQYCTSLKNSIPSISTDGYRRLSATDTDSVQDFREGLYNIINSGILSNFSSVEQGLLQMTSLTLDRLITSVETYSDPESITKMTVETIDEGGYPTGNAYIKEDGLLNNSQIYQGLLNGGAICLYNGSTRLGNMTVDLCFPGGSNPYPCLRDAMTAYNAAKGTSHKTVADMILSIVTTKIATGTNTAKDFLASIGHTEEDVKNFKSYLDAKNTYSNYEPVFEYVPNLPQRASYYEEIYKVLKSADGNLIECDEDRCQNPTWVSNMVKNGLVVLSTWDYDNEYLSKTAAVLNYEIKEVSNEDEIEKIASEYEETLAEINIKEKRFDKRLAVLESERQAIVTEVEGLKQVMDDNIDATFKVFG